jgi:hypothetical protein
MEELVLHGEIGGRIITLRGEQVMLDRDLADMYGVTTKRLNEQVKRNVERFPKDFMFQLDLREKDQLVAKCDWLESMKHSPSNPYAFTEQGIYMLASILKSPKRSKSTLPSFVRSRNSENLPTITMLWPKSSLPLTASTRSTTEN